jgi:hypothetical protein
MHVEKPNAFFWVIWTLTWFTAIGTWWLVVYCLWHFLQKIW